MYNPYEIIKLRKDIPAFNLLSGAVGTILLVLQEDPAAYEVEFCDSEGGTIALLTLTDKDLEPGDGDMGKGNGPGSTFRSTIAQWTSASSFQKLRDNLIQAAVMAVIGAMWVGWYLAPIWVNVAIGIPLLIVIVLGWAGRK